MGDSPRILLDWKPSGNNGLASITARLGDRVLYTDKFDPAKASARKRFVDALVEQCPGLDAVEIGVELMEIADKLAPPASPKPDSHGNEAEVEAASYLDEGIIAELAWNPDSGAPDFVVLDRRSGDVSRATELDTSFGRLVVPSFASGIVTPGGHVEGSVLVPTLADLDGCRASGDGELRAALREFINRYVELPNDADLLAVEYVLMTWVYDQFDELPYLAFRTADCGRGKSRALETVGAVCYRPLIVGGGSSSAAVLRMLDSLGGTLVCDEFDRSQDTELGADLMKILNQGFQRRRPLVKCVGNDNAPKAFRCYGPKIFALRQTLGDDASESRTISIRMRQRTRADIPLNLPRARFDAEALVLRNWLLAWRFVNAGRVALDPALADPALEDRLNQIGLPLLSVASCGTVRRRILAVLRSQQESAALERADSLPGEVFAVLDERYGPGDTIRPGPVATEVNRRRAEAQSIELDKLPPQQKLTAHKVGRVLRSGLELPADDPPRDSEGARYRLDRVRLDQLRRRLGGVPPQTSQSSPSSGAAERRPPTARTGAHDGARHGQNDVSDVSDVSAEVAVQAQDVMEECGDGQVKVPSG